MASAKAGRSWPRHTSHIRAASWIHPVLDCVLDWRRDNPKAEVTRIVVRGNLLLSDRTDRPNISTGRESQVSVQHAVAAALVTGKAGLEQFTDACAHDPEVLAAAQQGRSGARRGVLYRRGGSRDHHRRRHDPQAVAVGGARQRRSIRSATRVWRRKLRTAAARWDPRHDVAPLIDAIWTLDKKRGCFRAGFAGRATGLTCRSGNLSTRLLKAKAGRGVRPASAFKLAVQRPAGAEIAPPS